MNSIAEHISKIYYANKVGPDVIKYVYLRHYADEDDQGFIQ